MVCLASKPVVDGFERESEDRAIVLRANLQSDAGRELAQRYDIATVPSFVVLHHTPDDPVLRLEGTRGVPLSDLRRALREAEQAG